MTRISVCICTFKRPEPLKRLLSELTRQETEGEFVFSIVVADNDSARSAEEVVCNFAAQSSIAVRYCVEPRQGIALARNKVVENADGDFLAFIDDDEFPTPRWLICLLKTLREYNVVGVLGPVRPHFDSAPPRWVIDGQFHNRPEDPTGMRLSVTKCRTGNALLSRELFADQEHPFRPECLTGEDQDFFRRMIDKGHTFIWCNEAVVYEAVPPTRWTRGFLVRRAMFRGMFSIRNHNHRFPVGRMFRTFVAVPAYGVALPVALIFGQAGFMSIACKLSYHLGRIFGMIGLNPIRQPYVAE